MRTVALVACAGIALVGATRVGAAGNAPLRFVLPRHIVADRATTIVVRASRPQTEANLKVIVVAPNASVMDLVSALTKGTSAGSIRHVGFSVLARRSTAASWKVRLAFPRAGLWRLVVPNWTLTGYTTPFPALATVRVR